MTGDPTFEAKLYRASLLSWIVAAVWILTGLSFVMLVKEKSSE